MQTCNISLDESETESITSEILIYDYDNEPVDIQIKLSNRKEKENSSDSGSDTDSDNEDLNIPIEGTNVLRKIGLYEDLICKYKKRHNKYILNNMKKIGSKVQAVILDGKNLRTTKALMQCQRLVKRITIVEINKASFLKMKNKIDGHPKIELLNGHLYEYIEDNLSPSTNLIYLDLMSNYFNTENSFGTQSYLNKMLKTLKSEKVMLAATFCMRTTQSGMTFEKQEKSIIANLKEMCDVHKFRLKSLLKQETISYRGQRGCPMMFVLYMLEKVIE